MKMKFGLGFVTILFASGAAFFSSVALSEVLYKWTDDNGRVQYSDTEPKNVKGPVTRIEVDTRMNEMAAPPAKKPEPASKAATKNDDDYLAKRRATRAALEARVAQARANLEAAKKALAEASLGADEQQIVQGPASNKTRDPSPPPERDPRPSPEKAGPNTAGTTYGNPSQQNCRQVVGVSGKSSTVCATLVPNQAYAERIARLEEAVKVAELEVDEAERAYRRGVD